MNNKDLGSSAKRDVSTILALLISTVCFGVFLFDFINWDHHTGTLKSVIIYYVLPAASALFFLSLVKVSKGLRDSVVTATLALVFSLYISEGYFEFVSHKVDSFPVKLDAVKVDHRTKLEVIEALKKEGQAAYPYLTSQMISASIGKSELQLGDKKVWPLGSISNETLVVCREGSEYLTYKSDRHGYHNPPGIWDYKTIDVAAVGDSYTHGECVASNDNMVSLIRNKYPKTLNLGVSGTGPLHHLASIKEFLPDLQPEKVLWFFFEGNDMQELSTSLKQPSLVKYLEPGHVQGLKTMQADIDQKYKDLVAPLLISHKAFEKLQFRKSVIDFLKLKSIRLFVGLIRVYQAPQSDDSYTKFRTILSQADETVQSWGGQLYFVYLPTWARYHSYYNTGKEKILYGRIPDIVKGLGIPFIDAKLEIETTFDNPLTLYQGHFNEEGFRIVSEIVLNKISQTEK